MAAYLIANIQVKDPAKYEEYKKGVAATSDKFGGKFLARGGASKTLEGDVTAGRVVIIEFPDMAKLQAWYNSSDYAPLLDLRKAASDGHLMAVEGL
ncbi:MAG: DUF1330 domain-containing protein [Hyphomicrobiaceae bacterium]